MQKAHSGQKIKPGLIHAFKPMISVFNAYYWLNAQLKPGLIFLS